MNLLLPPANEVCEGYDFTGVCLSTGGGCLPHCMLGYTPPWGRSYPPGRYTPWAGTPPWQVHPRQVHPSGRYTPQGRYTPKAGTPPWQVHPPWAGTPPGRYTPRKVHTPPPPAQCMLGYGQQAGGTHPTGMQSCF